MGLFVEIITPEKVLFDGEVDRIQLPGTSGLFEMLNLHAPLISSLTTGNIKLTKGSDVQQIAIKDGFVECINNKVVVLVGSGQEVA